MPVYGGVCADVLQSKQCLNMKSYPHFTGVIPWNDEMLSLSRSLLGSLCTQLTARAKN